MVEKLRREVEPPQKHPTGLGVMLIASAAMFFVVAGSAFILRAQMSDPCYVRSQRAAQPAPRQAEIRPAPIASSADDCGRAVYRTTEDGTRVVTYELCTPAGDAL